MIIFLFLGLSFCWESICISSPWMTCTCTGRQERLERSPRRPAIKVSTEPSGSLVFILPSDLQCFYFWIVSTRNHDRCSSSHCCNPIALDVHRTYGCLDLLHLSEDFGGPINTMTCWGELLKTRLVWRLNKLFFFWYKWRLNKLLISSIFLLKKKKSEVGFIRCSVSLWSPVH